MVDDRVEPPEQPPTARMESVPLWAVEMAKAQQAGLKETRERFDEQSAALRTLAENDFKVTQQMAKFEVRLDNLEKLPSTPPLNSTGVKALIDGHPSVTDLSLQAVQASEILKNAERDKRIAETHEAVAKLTESQQKQSDLMGIGKKGMEWVRSKSARSDIVQFVTLIGVAYGAAKVAGIIK